MKTVFADTVFFVALLSADDQYHDQAIRLSGTIRSPILTTEFVLLEVANALSSAFRRQNFSNLWTQLHRDPSIRILPATSRSCLVAVMSCMPAALIKIGRSRIAFPSW